MFDRFEILLTKIECKLKVLRVVTYSEDRDYLDVDRWERFISNVLAQLEEFHLKYYQQIDPESEDLTYLEYSDRFTSSFWIKRKWIFDVEVDSLEIIYSIRPYKERWYDIDSSIAHFKSTQLTLTFLSADEYLLTFLITLRDIIKVNPIYHLEISKENIFSDMLIDLIGKLSKLHSLKLRSFSLSQSRYLLTNELFSRFVSNKNNITKVYLEKMSTFEEIYFLIKLCPRMEYLKIDSINNLDYQLFIRDVLMKINNDCNQYLRSLCIRIPIADDEIIDKLDNMITANEGTFSTV